jgi:hypothetical protein
VHIGFSLSLLLGDLYMCGGAIFKGAELWKGYFISGLYYSLFGGRFVVLEAKLL